MTWHEAPLPEVVSLRRGHDLPATSRNGGDVPVVGSAGISGWHNEAICDAPGLVVGRSGASIGKATYVTQPYWPLNTGLYATDFHGNDPYWVYLAVSQLDLGQLNSGSAQPSLNRNNLGGVVVTVPPVRAQRAIAEVLGAFDDKIAANAALSAHADALVRVMFDEFRASADSIRIDDLATNPRIGAKPPFGAGHYVGLEHVPRRLMWLTDIGDTDGLASGKFEFARDDVLFGKLRPYFHKVIVADRAGVCSTDILVLRPRSQAFRGFMWAAAASDGVVGRVSAMSEGTRMPRTDWNSLASSEVPWPGREPAEAFSERVVTLRDRVAAGIAESARLANLRDTLLPHLMSGRITVREAEKAVEEVL